jgi:hypothetical protein
MGIEFNVVLAPRLETDAILNAKASPIVEHTTGKFKILISCSCLTIFAFNLAM